MDELIKNLNTEIEMLKEIAIYSRKNDYATEHERRLLNTTIDALKEGLKIINETMPELIREISIDDKSTSQKKSEEKTKVKFKSLDSELEVILKSKDKKRFLKEILISEKAVKKLRSQGSKKTGMEKYGEFKPSRGYVKLGNKWFLDYSSNLLKKGYFKSLYFSLKKANFEILLDSYIAIMIMTTIVSFILCFFLMIILLYLNFSFELPYYSIYSGS